MKRRVLAVPSWSNGEIMSRYEYNEGHQNESSRRHGLFGHAVWKNGYRWWMVTQSPQATTVQDWTYRKDTKANPRLVWGSGRVFILHFYFFIMTAHVLRPSQVQYSVLRHQPHS